jgi:lipopolysaccharide transport system permease protein
MAGERQAAAGKEPGRPLVHVRAVSGLLPLNLREVWDCRELLGLLVWRNTIAKYKQSVAGIGWAIIRPVAMMVVFTFLFGRIARLDSEGLPYPIFAYAALLPWAYFATGFGGVSMSLSGNLGLMSNVYFPRLVPSLAAVLTGLVDFAISFLVLLALMAWYHASVTVTWGVALLPAFLVLAMATALGFGLWLASLAVRYRDVQHLLPFLTTIWLYLTPVAYSVGEVPQRWRVLYTLNPMATVVQGFRWGLLGARAPDPAGAAAGCLVALAVLIGGLYVLRRTETTFVDIA